jgi:hypothetical protein
VRAALPELADNGAIMSPKKEIDITQVEGLEVDGVVTTDYPDFVDSYFSAGTIGGVELTDDELEQLGVDYPEHLNEMAFEHYL